MSNGSSPPGDIGTRTKRGLKNNQFPLADSGVLGDVNITIFLFNMQTHPKDFLWLQVLCCYQEKIPVEKKDEFQECEILCKSTEGLTFIWQKHSMELNRCYKIF